MPNQFSYCYVSFPKCKWKDCTNHVIITHDKKSEYCSNNCRQAGRRLFPISEKVRQAGRDAAKRNGSGYKKGSGRGKSGWYKGYWCDSSYELAYVIFNIDHNIQFNQNRDRFEYILDNKKHVYIPDFILPDGSYVEIKGYTTKVDLEKWRQFPKNLKVLTGKELTYAIEYAKVTYGKDYINLYGK